MTTFNHRPGPVRMKPGALLLTLCLLLTVATGLCADLSTGLEAYYPLNGNANDASGNSRDGNAINGLSYVADRWDSVANFNGNSQYISLPNSISNYADLSISFWVKTSGSNPNTFPSGLFLVSRDIPGGAYDWNICLGQGRKIEFVVSDDVLALSYDIGSNQWVHVACVTDSVSQQKRIFLDGQPAASASWSPFVFANNNVPIFLGAATAQTDQHAFLTGSMAHVRVYGRALSASEVQQLYAIDPFPLIITQQPQSLVVAVGGTTNFTVTATGTAQLSYQWRKEGSPINGATNNSLPFTSATLNDTGNYDVVVTNSYGSATSSNAVLQVLPPNAPIIRVNNNLAAGTVTVGTPANITITGGFSGGFIFYTLDGSTPTTSSTFYPGPFSISNSKILRAMSLSADFMQSSEAPPVNVVVLPVYALEMSVSGGGGINASPPNGPYISNSVVTLTAQASANWAFDHWSGDLSGSANPAAVTMNGPRSVQAVFVPTAYPLSLGTAGGGSVTANGLSIAANTYYPTGSVVQLQATANSGWSFLGWQGTAPGTANPLSLTMTQTQNVQAIFGTVVSTNIAGSGSIVMGATNPVPYGTLLTLTAVPVPGYRFVTWSGAVSGINNPTALAVTNTGLSVGALFTPVSCTPAPAGLVSWWQVGIVVVDGADLAHQVHAVGTGIVEPAYERRDERGAGLGRQQRLVGREAQRHVDHRALPGQRPARLQARPGQRHLDGDVRGDLCQHAAFSQHALEVGGGHLGAHRPRHERADLGDDLLEVALGLGHQRGVGGDAVDEAGGGQLLDFGHVCRIHEEFHTPSNVLARAAQRFPSRPLFAFSSGLGYAIDSASRF